MDMAKRIAKTALYIFLGAVSIAAITLVALAFVTRFAGPPRLGESDGVISASPPYSETDPDNQAQNPGDSHSSGHATDNTPPGGDGGQVESSPFDSSSSNVDVDVDDDNGDDGDDAKEGDGDDAKDDANNDGDSLNNGSGIENGNDHTGPGTGADTGLHSPNIGASLPPDIIAPDNDVQSAINSIAQKYGAVGVQVAVIKNGRITGTYEYGYATRGAAPMAANTKIRIASISKVILTMAIMRLVELGQLDLDKDIGEYWGFNVRNPNHKETPITIRQILTHTSSIRDYDYGFPAGGELVRSRLQDGSCFGSGAPGALSSFVYNNYAFATLGVTVETAAEETVNSIASRYFFKPLGIDAAFGSGSIKDTDNLATLYTSGGGVGRSVDAQKRALGNSYPGERGEEFPGGLTISAYDLAKLIAVLINDGEYEGVRVLSRESVAMMEASQGMVEGFEQCLTLRRRRNVFGQEELIYHTGSNYGVYTLFSYNPLSGNAVIVLTSGASDSRDANFMPVICAEISRYIYANM